MFDCVSEGSGEYSVVHYRVAQLYGSLVSPGHCSDSPDLISSLLLSRQHSPFPWQPHHLVISATQILSTVWE